MCYLYIPVFKPPDLQCLKQPIPSLPPQTLNPRPSQGHSTLGVGLKVIGQDLCEGAESLWDKKQLELAKELSLSLTEEQEKERQQSQEIIEARLRASGLTRVAVPRDGNCQFLSIVLSAGIPIDAFRLRSEIVSYLQRLPSMFNFWFDTHFKDFNAYCRHMSRDGSWGDECTLQAAAHLLLRPIRIVTDTVVQDDGDGMPFDREFLPPAIAEELWGAPVTLAYSGYNHYEAAEVPVQAKKPKRERDC